MRSRTFDDVLKDFHMRDFTGSKENWESAFEVWVEDLSRDRLIGIANIAMREAELRGIAHGGQVAVDAINRSFT